MKQLSILLIAAALAVSAFAQDAGTNSVAGTNQPAAEASLPGQTFPASAAVLTAPLMLTNDYLCLASAQAEVDDGGKAVFSFTVTNAGNYVIDTVVSAPDESSNSFFVNMDAPPTDPDMIWDVPLTTGFEQRQVSWRGSGTDSSDEFVPKQFKLEPGAHTLIFVGREPGTLLKSLTIRLDTKE